MDKSSQELEVVKQSIRESIPYIRGKKIRPSPEAIFKLLRKNFHLELQTFKEALSELEYDEEITNKGKVFLKKENASDNESIYSESSLVDITHF